VGAFIPHKLHVF